MKCYNWCKDDMEHHLNKINFLSSIHKTQSSYKKMLIKVWLLRQDAWKEGEYYVVHPLVPLWHIPKVS